MDDVCRVQILHALEDLIHDEAVMDVLEDLLPDGVVQVGLHVLKNQIEILVIFGADDVEQLDYVVVIEFVQVADLSVGSLRVYGVLEGVEYFFESESGVGLAIRNFPDVTVGA